MNKERKLGWGMRISLGIVWVWSISLIISGAMLIGAKELVNQPHWLIILGCIVNIMVIKLYEKNENKYFTNDALDESEGER